MLVGQTLNKGSISYSPWFSKPPSVDGAVFGVYIHALESGAALTAKLQTKKHCDPDHKALTKATISESTTGCHSAVASNLEELVRIQYFADGSVDLAYVHVETVPLMWLHDSP